jgi:hypothetical protein
MNFDFPSAGLDSINAAVHHWKDALNRIEQTEPDSVSQSKGRKVQLHC